MEINADACYQAIKSHDSRFDGHFFVGVSSTGIYCRPVCRVRTPQARYCHFYPSAAAAEAKGYRPCLRCRPELAPSWSTTDASSRLAHSAAHLIEQGLDQSCSMATLAKRIGVSSRHLRRIFSDEFGVSPVQYAQTQRLLLAKRLLTDTQLPVTAIVFASGFSSVRRMNSLFAERYGFPPSRLRSENRETKRSSYRDGLSFALAYRPPFDWDGLLAFFEKRTIPGVESIVDGIYSRLLSYQPLNGKKHIIAWIQVENAAENNALRVRLAPAFATVIPGILAQIKRVFDLCADPAEITTTLGPLAADAPGLRLPGSFDRFELTVRAVLGQQVTVKAARTLATRFVAAFGELVTFDNSASFPGLSYTFPTADRVAQLTQDDIARLGIVAQRANAIIDIARQVTAGTLDLSADSDINAFIHSLQTIKGIGAWTAHYIAMRALTWPDAWPPHDVALLNALDLPNTAAGQREADARAEKWRPWRSYAVLHAWRQLALKEK